MNNIDKKNWTVNVVLNDKGAVATKKKNWNN